MTSNSKPTFDRIPILDYSLLTTGRKDEFVSQLRHTMIFVGFLYLANTPIENSLFDRVIEYAPRLFELPQEKKDALRMANSPTFLGYSRFGAELTRGAVDQREQIDLAIDKNEKWKPGEPEYTRLQGKAQWPSEEDLPGFRETVSDYFSRLETLSYDLIGLIAEALGLPSSGLSEFFDQPGTLQHRGKIVKYPAPKDESSSDQGVGPHFDAGFLTLLLQASEHRGLQVQAPDGLWVDAPPIPYTLVVNFGKGLEAATQGLARATSHRVLSPTVGSTPRYSIPFFQRIRQEIKLTDFIPEIPSEVLALKEQRGENGTTDSVNYSEYDREPSGLVELIGRVKSHPDVAQRHYPRLFKQFFPQGLPAHGMAY